MKNAICVALIGIVSSMAFSDKAAATPSFPLYCRGGGSFSFLLTSTGVNSGSQLGLSIDMSFAKSANAASPATLNPGECAWGDRPLNGAEPAAMRDVVTNQGFPFLFEFTSCSVGRCSFSTPVDGPTRFRYLPSVVGTGAANDSKNSVLDANTYLEFQIYNAGSTMVVTQYVGKSASFYGPYLPWGG